MKVAKEKQVKWAVNKQHGDIQLISDESGVSKHKVRKAFDFGEADQETADAIDSFFKKRDKQIIA